MAGMSRETGKALSGWDHLTQSIGDIMSTPLFTRVWRREYGGKGTYLVDKPGTTESLLAFTVALGEAIDKWEPRYRLRRVWFETAGSDGVFTLNLDGIYFPMGHKGDFSTGVQKGIEVPFPLGYMVTGTVFE